MSEPSENMAYSIFLFLNLKVSLEGYQFGFTDKTHGKKKMLQQPTNFLKIKSIMLGKMAISL